MIDNKVINLNPNKDIQKYLGFIKYFVIFILLLFFINFLSPFIIIGAGERGVVLTWGAVDDKIFDEGLHIRIPFMQRIIKVDVKVQKAQTDADSASKDLQDIHTTIALNYHIDPAKVNWVYQSLGIHFKDRIIDPTVQEVIKAVTARYTAIELITQRERVRGECKDILKERLAGYNVLVDDFSIVNFHFSQQFTQAIEQKQTAEQLALKAQRDLDRIKIEAEQKIAQAQAEAEALRIQKENVTPLLVDLREIEAKIKAIEKWDGKLPNVVGGAVPFIDVQNNTTNRRSQ